MSKNVVYLSFACTVVSSFSRGNVFAVENSTVDTNKASCLEDGKIVLSKIKDRGKIHEIIDAMPIEKRPSFDRWEWFEDENGSFLCEDRIYDPYFWKLPVKIKLKRISFLKYDEIFKIVSCFSEEEKSFVYDFYKNKLLEVKSSVGDLNRKIKKVCNFRKILVESFEKRSLFKKFLDFLFSKRKDLSDENLSNFCEPDNTGVSSEKLAELPGKDEEEKLKDVFLELSKVEEEFGELEKQYNKEISEVTDIFKKQFPSMKKILTDFYGEDAISKFDPEKVDFKDKNTPKEIKILKNAQKILEVDLSKLL